MMAFGVVSFNVECRKQAYNDTGRFLETRTLEKEKGQVSGAHHKTSNLPHSI